MREEFRITLDEPEEQRPVVLHADVRKELHDRLVRLLRRVEDVAVLPGVDEVTDGVLASPRPREGDRVVGEVARSGDSDKGEQPPK